MQTSVMRMISVAHETWGRSSNPGYVLLADMQLKILIFLACQVMQALCSFSLLTPANPGTLVDPDFSTMKRKERQQSVLSIKRALWTGFSCIY